MSFSEMLNHMSSLEDHLLPIPNIRHLTKRIFKDGFFGVKIDFSNCTTSNFTVQVEVLLGKNDIKNQ
jgi:hypothetical protein